MYNNLLQYNRKSPIFIGTYLFNVFKSFQGIDYRHFRYVVKDNNERIKK